MAKRYDYVVMIPLFFSKKNSKQKPIPADQTYSFLPEKVETYSRFIRDKRFFFFLATKPWMIKEEINAVGVLLSQSLSICGTLILLI